MANKNPNTKGLKPTTKMTPEEKKAFQSKGGKASVKKRNETRTLREILSICMSMPATDTEGKRLVNPVTGEELNNKEAAMVALARQAADGKLPSIRTVAELLGELEQVGLTGELTIDCSES